MTKEIIFVTSNQGKIASARSVLQDINEIEVIPYDAELIEPRGDDVQYIAKQKVIQAYKMVQKPCISLDAGFYVRALGGFPKAYVNHMLDTIGIDGIIKLMDGVEDRFCEFVSCVAYYDGEHMEFFVGKSPGTIAPEKRGTDNPDKWSDLWFIFMPKGYDKTLAEFIEDDFIKYNKEKEESSMHKFGNWYRTHM